MSLERAVTLELSGSGNSGEGGRVGIWLSLVSEPSGLGTRLRNL